MTSCLHRLGQCHIDNDRLKIKVGQYWLRRGVSYRIGSICFRYCFESVTGLGRSTPRTASRVIRRPNTRVHYQHPVHVTPSVWNRHKQGKGALSKSSTGSTREHQHRYSMERGTDILSITLQDLS
jgi:hypothetical protein